MRKLWIVATVMAAAVFSAPAKADLVLEFFLSPNQGSAASALLEPALGTTQLTQVNLMAGTGFVNVQVALHQTAGTSILTQTNPGVPPGNGLASTLFQAGYSGPAGNFFVPATNNSPTGTTPSYGAPNDTFDIGGNATGLGYSIFREYRSGANQEISGGTQATATGFRGGSGWLNPSPSGGVDANGRILVGTVRVTSGATAPGGLSNLVIVDPDPSASGVQFVADNGTNLDPILFGAAHPSFSLPINVTPIPEPSSFVLAGLVSLGAIGLRLRRKPAVTAEPEATV